jgi:hypothetical protein
MGVPDILLGDIYKATAWCGIVRSQFYLVGGEYECILAEKSLVTVRLPYVRRCVLEDRLDHLVHV